MIEFLPGRREYHLGLVLCCINCAAITELDPQTGNLAEFPRVRIMNLTVPENWQELPHTTQSLGRSLLYLGKES